MLGIASELCERGHDVTMFAASFFQEPIERCGLRYVEIGSEEQFYAAARNPDVWHPRRAFGHLFRSVILPNLRQQYQLFADHYRPGETVGVVNCLGFGGLVAQEKLGLPVATLHVQPAVIWSDAAPPKLPGVVGPRWLKSAMYRLGERLVIDRAVCPSLNAIRGELGLPPMKQTTRWWHSPRLVICSFPDWYAAPQSDWPAQVVQTSFPLWDERNDYQMPGEVEEFLAAGDAPIAFTPGSGNMLGQSFFAAAADACQRLGRRGILLTRFPETLPESLPEGVKHFEFVPLRLLLPRCAAMVHHGGVGTTSQALAAGVPQLIMPLAHDQFDNAARVKAFGVGDWLKVSRFRGPAVADKLAPLLNSEQVRRACGELAERFQDANGPAEAADALERLAGEAK